MPTGSLEEQLRPQLLSGLAYERLLAEAVGAEESRRESIEELNKQHRVVFVLHRTEVEETLEDFVREGDRLVSVVPRRGGETISEGLKGSWLVFESSE